jgi:hypothetical protein
MAQRNVSTHRDRNDGANIEGENGAGGDARVSLPERLKKNTSAQPGETPWEELK